MTATVQILNAGNAEDAQRWDDLVAQAPLADVYYRHGYALAHEQSGHGKAIGLVVDLGDAHFLLPMLVRELRQFPEAEGWCDTYSPYGYGGMLALTPVSYSRALLARLVEALRGWALDAKVVSCLLRLHPLLPQAQVWSEPQSEDIEHVRVVIRGPTVAIDLGRWEAKKNRLAGLSHGRYYDLKRARRHLNVTWADNGNAGEAIEIFRSMYDATMQRLGADDFYFFPREYYRVLAERLGERFGLAIAWHRGEPAGAAVFLRDRNFGHYHLSGTNELGRRYKAATLLVNAGAAWCRDYGSRVLHLGGGIFPQDPLFEFKRSFGGAAHSYAFVNVVAEPHRFDALRKNAAAPWPYAEPAAAPPEIVGAKPAKALAAFKAGSVPTQESVAGVTAAMVSESAQPMVLGIGAGGHARVVLDILRLRSALNVVGLIDSAPTLWGSHLLGVRVLGGEDLLPNLRQLGIDKVFVGIGGVGDNHPRAEVFARMQRLGFQFVNAIHPRAIVAQDVRLGEAVVIAAGAIVNPGAVVGNNVIINSGAIVEHDCVISDDVHIAPGAVISAAVAVGRGGHIGTGASVRQGIRIGDWGVVGAGAVVVHDVPAGVTVVGVPARPLARSSHA